MNFAREDAHGGIPRVVRAGDVVICYCGHNSLDYSVMRKNEVIQNRFGAFRHDDIIGKPFGQKHYTCSEDSKHHMIVLEPTPELWSNALRTRTQIVDEMDASLVTFMLNVIKNTTRMTVARAELNYLIISLKIVRIHLKPKYSV